MRAHPLEHTDDHPEPGGVEEVDAAQVDHQVRVARGRQPHHLLAQLGRGGHVELARDRQHGTVVALGDT